MWNAPNDIKLQLSAGWKIINSTLPVNRMLSTLTYIFMENEKRSHFLIMINLHLHIQPKTDQMYTFNALYINLDESTYQKPKQTSATECI